MINNVNFTLLRQCLCFYCLSKLIIRLTHDVCIISLLFRIVSGLNKFHLPLFMNNKVNVTLLRQFLGLYCLSKLIIRLTHDVFLISFLFRIVCNENQFHLPLFMINKVSVTIIRTVYLLLLSIQAYYMANSRWFLNIIIIKDRF